MVRSHSLSRRLLLGATAYSLIMLLVIALILAVLNRRQQLAALDFELEQDVLALSSAVFDCSIDPTLCIKAVDQGSEDNTGNRPGRPNARNAPSNDFAENRAPSITPGNSSEAIRKVLEVRDPDEPAFSAGITSDDLIISDNGLWALQRRKMPADPDFFDLGSGRFWGVAEIGADNEVVTFLDSLGSEFAATQSDSLWFGRAEFQQVLTSEDLEFFDLIGLFDESQALRIASRLISYGGRTYLLVASEDRAANDTLVNVYVAPLFVAFSIFAVGLIVFLIVLVRLGLKPLVRARHDVVAVREGGMERLTENYPIELQPLTEEVNKLLDHNKEVVERARTQVGNLAHALKTPIAVLMNETAGSDEPLAQLVRRQTENMSHNVQHYLSRAQAAARAQALGARSEVKPAIEDICRLLNRLYERQGISVVADDIPALLFRGERQDLDDMLGNLMENACKWAATRVDVSLEPTSATQLTIHIDDDGPGLTLEQREQAMKRGVRLDETTPGTGLGLSIVKELAELYSGEFLLEDSPAGGLRATLILPRIGSRQGRN